MGNSSDDPSNRPAAAPNPPSAGTQDSGTQDSGVPSNSDPGSPQQSGGDQHSGGEQWGTRLGVILAVAGSAVGLGNFLRFPGQAAANGGGAFLLPYFISLLILGIPLCWAEWTMGRFGGLRGFNSAPGIFSVVCRTPKARYLAVPALLIPLVIYMYYVLIEAWCLAYAVAYANGTLMQGADSEAYTSFFDGLVGTGKDGAVLGGSTNLLYYVGFTFVLNFILIYRGVAKGIETFCRIAIPLMVICALCVLFRVLTLPAEKVNAGLGFMWNPDFSALFNPETWLAASGQIFFSLSVGFGVIINYSSYLKKKDDVVLSGLTACSMNEFFEVCLGGLITLPAAFIFLGASAGEQGTFGLGFIALPNVFAQMPWGGQFFGFLWFFMLFLAAITSSLSMLQPVIAFFEEGFGLKRHASVSMLGFIALCGSGFVLYFSAEMKALDTFDFWVGTFLIFLLAMIQAVMYGWVFGIKRAAVESEVGSFMKIPTVVQYMLKYVVPVYLSVIFVSFIWNNVLDKVNAETGERTPGYLSKIANDDVIFMSLLFIGGTIAFLTLMVHLAGKRWIKQGRFDNIG
ncbi:sodium-dependent transporter [Stieleria sp. TO1_6]|uniref:sodium-dependent transporter n=1 Tax=Stieleria tagensis TaxID=2956795 RepID=UPI00209A7333|nr:sodium-dependent transporter [Stieleria tagensis]MCO8124143.1 sodium-dependent transporter [Stieleria tagensis]